jgi:hypothetical protein
MMTVKRRPRVCWDNVERVVKLLLGIAGEIARLIDAVHGGR